MLFKLFDFRVDPHAGATGSPQHVHVLLLVILSLCVILCPFASTAADIDIEKAIQADLEQSRAIILIIQNKIQTGASVSSEISGLKAAADDIRISNLLIEERFKLRAEKVKSLGSKALERHQAMVEGYKKALTEYLDIVDGLPLSSQESVNNRQDKINKLKRLLDKLAPKKKNPIIGTLPYKHLNYPAQEPSSAPTITPAYKGGNRVVSPEDIEDTPEAPIAKEIAILAQSLNWQPVAIYEYVKNNVETEWYWGCMKGAEETLHQKSGNDCDQATLLTALLRASGFPTRYVRGTMEFFAGGRNGVPMERIKNLTGIDDPAKIAEYFQKAGIPYKPVIQGGKIANFQIEHIWVESQIPYANYRGIVIDDNGKTWLGLDTSIKTKDYVYNNPRDIFQEPGVSSQFSGIWDAYLSAIQTQTPLEYLRSCVNSELAAQNPQLSYTDFLQTRTLSTHIMKILPNSMQIVPVRITNEYTSIPDELIHKVKFSAVSGQPSANSDILFEITLPLYKLSNQKIAITCEPETVQDQEIIDSYGGLDNTPTYLVRLRPMLTINKERIVVAKDGLPMGAEYDLTVELIGASGVQSSEKATNTHIAGNLSVIGITAGKTARSTEFNVQSEMDAERLLYETIQHYIDRWNKSEDELASLFHLTIARPIPTVVTLGGVIDVTYLMGVPHGFTWKGNFVDADLRTIETVQSSGSGVQSERQKLFMQLSSLQGSVLENRIFEDDWQVPGISTAKLIQIANQGAGLLAIDKTNIYAILPTLSVDDNIKEDMVNAVNQGYKILTPNSELTYKDWSGIGYVKENPVTGESGWMLSGMIAGGMTAVSPDKWISQDIETILSSLHNDDSRDIYITSPANETTVSTPAVVVTGYVLDPEVTVTVNGVPAIVQDTEFTATINLTSGANTITAVATNKAGKKFFDMIVIRYKIPLAIAITYPFEGADLALSPIFVEGFVSDPATSLYVNGIKTQPASDGHFLANGVRLTDGANQLIASSMNTDGDLASQTITVNYHASQTQPSLAVNITTPTNSATINKPSTTVIGTVTTTAEETWVIVNGIPAVIYGNQFIVNNVPLTDGSNRIIINAMDSNGAMDRAELSVTANTTAPYVQLSANITSGTSPLNTYFTVNTSMTGTIIGYQLDFGDGSTPYVGTTFDVVTHMYTTEDIVHPVLTINDSTNNIYTDTICIVIQNRAEIDALMKNKWNGMKTQLNIQNINGATAFIISTERDRYTEIFNAVGPRLPQIVQNMQDIQLIHVNNNSAKYRIRKNIIVGGQTQTITYYIYFSVDKNGMWKINKF